MFIISPLIIPYCEDYVFGDLNIFRFIVSFDVCCFYNVF